MTERTIADLIVRLKAEGAEETKEEVEKVQKSTRRQGVLMEKVSKRWGLAFKAAGLFAAGLFASILKGGPVTTSYIKNLWQSIGFLGDTILQKTGAWGTLGQINEDIIDMNRNLRENESLSEGFGAWWKGILERNVEGSPAKRFLDRMGVDTENHSFWDKMKSKWSDLKTSTINTVESLKEALAKKWETIKEEAATAWRRIKNTIAWWIYRARQTVQKHLDKMKDALRNTIQYFKDNPVVKYIRTVRESVGSAVSTFSKIPKFDDFIMRPGQGPVRFSPRDTIIGVKNPQALGVGGGGDIHIHIHDPVIKEDYDIDRIARDVGARMLGELRRLGA